MSLAMLLIIGCGEMTGTQGIAGGSGGSGNGGTHVPKTLDSVAAEGSYALITVNDLPPGTSKPVYARPDCGTNPVAGHPEYKDSVFYRLPATADLSRTSSTSAFALSVSYFTQCGPTVVSGSGTANWNGTFQPVTVRGDSLTLVQATSGLPNFGAKATGRNGFSVLSNQDTLFFADTLTLHMTVTGTPIKLRFKRQ